jgi:ABC-2 type transport system ATP-binding protein
MAQELSRGMRQKVAICCAYLHDPRVILFDEPLTGLDPYAIRSLKASIVDRAAAGAAIIVSSHLLSLVEDLCTHLLILNKGRCLFAGTREEARAQYAGLQGDASLEEVFFRATAQVRAS